MSPRTAKNKKEKEEYLKIDDRGRINLSKISVSKEITSYKAYHGKNGIIVLKPAVEITIPYKEAWLYKNPEALKKVRKGLEDSANRKIKKRESYAKYADDETE